MLTEVVQEQGHTITVSLPDRKAVVQDGKGEVVRSFDVYVGSAKYPTLTGHFQILPEEKDLSSDVAYAGIFIPFHEYPDPDNDPAGPIHWVAVAGFHGWKYGPEDQEEEERNPGWMTTTEGCIQMTNEDIAAFAALVRVGDPVMISDMPVAQIASLSQRQV